MTFAIAVLDVSPPGAETLEVVVESPLRDERWTANSVAVREDGSVVIVGKGGMSVWTLDAREVMSINVSRLAGGVEG